MNVVGFILSLLYLLMLLIYRRKVGKAVAVKAGIGLVASIPILILLMFLLAYMDIMPSEDVLVAPFVCLQILCVLTLFTYLSGRLVTNLINYQKKIGNEEKPFIEKVINARFIITDVYQFVLIIGAAIGMYGLWFKADF